MKVFLTGATGFIGAVLRDQLLENGQTVHALYRPSSNRDIDRGRTGIRYFPGDLLDPESLERAMEGCRQVYHVAACARVWSRDPSLFEKVNVTGTRNVLEAAKKRRVERVVFTSSAATLPASGEGDPVTEAAEKMHFETEYARTKHLAEELVRRYSREDLPGVIVNPPRVYGPGRLSESNAATKIIKWYLEGKWRMVPGSGSFLGNYTFVEDVAAGHRLAMERGRPGERYILGGENLTFSEYLGLAGEVSGARHKLWRIPMPLIHSLAAFEQWKADTLGRAPLITPQWVENYMQHSALSSRKAVSELNYRITPAREAIGRTVRWLREKAAGEQ